MRVNRKRRYQIIMSLVVMLVLLFTTSLTALASSDETTIVDGSKLIEGESTESVLYNPAKGNILNRAVVRLTNNGNGSVNMYGGTFGSIVCDKVSLNMTLQRLQGGNWVNVKSYSDTLYNASTLTKSYNIAITKGYYYRIKAACIATDNGVSESQMPITDGLWIN